MLGNIEYTMNDLFVQLGLDNSDAAIEQFIATHQLDEETQLDNAPFWNDAQQGFIREEWRKDAVWSLILDELNAQLHGE
ncbi:DUF2789 domain-containing protein [Moraxella sp. FZLJ2107]|uniref:DUF2789 domain-containing protein n=1 Tax=unclassified Moraxella TaxID=2685852 RepID=UPI0020C85879|nr:MULTISPECIES: DUF2789 domain-containing protein [unclassified Moraxella]UTO04954.1 DUF2789 domain-containing protein [Moraxella sp. FZLJ2107]UTO21688.1 DUF2789 domain-containing protein [Moraxella sp. FZLJ2109]